MTADWARDLFRSIAVPRLPGTAAVSRVEALVSDRLRSFGYNVSHHSFDTAPHRLRAGSVGAVLSGWSALLLFPLLVLPAPTPWAATAGAVLLAFVGIAVAWVASGGGSSSPPVTANNLLARGASPTRLWLVAHSDSKGQRVSLRGRALSFMTLSAGVSGLVACLAWRWFGPVPGGVVAACVGLTLVGAAGMSGPALVGGSPGAVDNASGIIAALTAAELLQRRSDVGILITGAEEFGMEGARAWIATEDASGVFINFDGIDHRGAFNIMRHSARRALTRASGEPTVKQLVRVVRERLSSLGHPVRLSRLPLGVFVDGSVLAHGGLRGITLSRGDWSTLGVVHTQRDTAERTSHASAVAAGEMVAHSVASFLG